MITEMKDGFTNFQFKVQPTEIADTAKMSSAEDREKNQVIYVRMQERFCWNRRETVY